MLRAYSPPAMQRTHYLFIDGGYLDKVLEDMRAFNEGRSIEINYEQLGSGFSKVFYYHCPPPPLKDEEDRDYDRRIAPYLARMAHLGELRGWHVSHGVIKRHPKRGNTQKEVDVQISVDLLTHSFRGNMDEATLIAGDQDFRPVVEAVVREGMFLTLWSDWRSTSESLRRSADHRRAFDIWQVREFMRMPKLDLPQQHNWLEPSMSAPSVLVQRGFIDEEVAFFVYRDPGTSWFYVVSQDRLGPYYRRYDHTDFGVLRRFLETLVGKGIRWEVV